MRCRPPFIFCSAPRGLLFVLFCLVFCVLSSAGFAGGSAPEPFPVGLRTFGVWEPDTGERFDFAVWYPSRVPSSENILEGWIVNAGKRGRIVQGFFPVVLLSHDTAGGRFAHNDIAEALASGGMIVVAPTHSGDNQNSSSGLYKAETLRARPLNMLRALETVLASPDFAPHADESRIGVLGFGAGAVTAMQLAGAEPDFSGIGGYCLNVSVPDAYCAPWGEQRLLRVGPDMDQLRREKGADYFTPALDMLAPELMSVPVPPEILERHAAEGRAQRKNGLWQRLFGGEEDETPSDPESVPQGRDDQAQGQPAREANGLAVTAPEAVAEALTAVSAGGAAPDAKDSSPEATPHETGLYPEEPVRKPRIVDGIPVFHRPAATRAIRGIALVAPAGGMLFSRESLAVVSVPAAVVEAGRDALYPPEFHAAPYISRLPLLPLRLRLPHADHFSLFAGCSKDTMNSLSAICGRIRGDEREALARERDAFLTSFFQSVLGGPLAVPPPSGLAALAPPEDVAR